MSDSEEVQSPFQTLMDLCFSLEADAKSVSSCDHETPQMILEWASFSFLTRLNWRSSGFTRLNNAHERSREHDSRY